ncbi:uncharacterized protein MELLADRAFT_106711 [Melampsora larici-populina 98AG31]|uniref:Uncharacterized protein n=1 Tax=Melampsora larici-populina (strain 98AG31 / pathotype 3-4-7) TaxID=747676 RepID=F4RME1_MELLP|nr:uncharacterized protein MELLADRAFT_106711 [Melampsora larici-populina 98AG31]EGG06489.1 hypothetical protein MELLADRAFT_106711 [Melampsora larici-populina 98AG31]
MSLYHSPIQSIHPFLNQSSSTTTTTRLRPTLKRSQSPYTSDHHHHHHQSNQQDRKKRKTSPSGAFAKLSLTTHHTSPSNESDPIKATVTTTSLSDLQPNLSLDTHSDQRMRSVYSAYEIGPDRIFVDSLGSEPSSPIESVDLPTPKLTITCQIPMIPKLPIPDTLDKQDQQLVLYKAPVHLTLNHHLSTSSNLGEPSRILESDDLLHDVPMELD